MPSLLAGDGARFGNLAVPNFPASFMDRTVSSLSKVRIRLRRRETLLFLRARDAAKLW